jgi:hypothetical protein
MGRPPGYQWQPLGWDTDPVPGDPQEIGQEARLLASVANQIHDQIAALQKIASDQVNVGRTPDKIRSAASELAGSLQAVATRYQKVSSALAHWAPELEQAQAISIRALNEAEAPYAKLNQAFVAPPGDSLHPLKMQADIQDYHHAMQRAQGELDAAKALLNQAISLRDTQASHYAGIINSASSDSLTDSWWDKFESWVSDYAWLIKDICTGLEILATVAAVLALIFTGVGWIVLLGLALTAVALVGRTMLAAAGNGSWADFGVDAFALVTFGAGGVVTRSLGKTVDGMVDLAKGMETAKVADMLDSFGKIAGGAARQRVLTKFLGKTVPVIEDSARTTLWERLSGAGDRGIVNMMKTVAGLGDKFGDSPAIKALADQAKTLENVLRVIFAASNVFSAGSLAGGGIELDGPNGPTGVNWHIPGLTELYKYAGDKTTTYGGFSTATANGTVDDITLAAPPIGLPLQGFRWALSSL